MPTLGHTKNGTVCMHRLTTGDGYIVDLPGGRILTLTRVMVSRMEHMKYGYAHMERHEWCVRVLNAKWHPLSILWDCEWRVRRDVLLFRTLRGARLWIACNVHRLAHRQSIAG